MKLSEKLLSLLLVMLVLLGSIPIAYAQAPEQIADGDFVYSVSGTEAILTAYTGSGGTVTIPAAVQGYSVISIDDNVFYKNKLIKKVIFEEGLCHIGDQAFFDCNQLESITLPESLVSIGEMAFDNCFALKTVVIPKNVQFIGTSAFSNCVGLQSLQVNKDNPYFMTENSVIFSKDGKTLLYYYNFTDSSYTLPGCVLSIGERAFSNNRVLQNVILADGLQEIHKYAFCNSGLQTIRIPNSVTVLENFAFRDCDQLQEVSLGTGVETIADYSFSNCKKLNSVTLPEGVKALGNRAFSNCDTIEHIVVPDSLTDVADNAFSGTSLNTVRFYSKRQKQNMADVISGSNIVCLCLGEHTYAIAQPDQCNVCDHSRDLMVPPMLDSKAYDTVKLITQSGFEYSYDKMNWRADGTFTDLSPNETYYFYCRPTGTDLVSNGLSVTTDKAPQPKASAPEIQSVTNITVTLKVIGGCEYSMDGITWQESAVFSDLEPLKTYKFYQRFAATDTHLVGETSEFIMVLTMGAIELTSTVFTVKDDIVCKIPVNTSVDTLLNNLSGGQNCRVMHGATQQAGSSVVGTGMTVQVLIGERVEAVYTLVVTGDTNSDGKISITDMLAVKSHILKKTILSGAAAQAADTSKDGGISITDFIQIKASILGKSTVVPN